MDRVNQIIKKAKADKDVLAVALFGSSLKGKGRDIDLCIFIKEKKSNLEMSRKQLEFLKIAKKGIDIQIFQQLPVYIRIRILKEGKILFSKDDDLLYGLAFNTLKEFESYKKIYETYLKEVENGQRKDIIKI